MADNKIILKGDKDYLELNAFVKLKGLASTGGKAKLIIRSGIVNVNGVVETRNKKKLQSGDKVTIGKQSWVVEF